MWQRGKLAGRRAGQGSSRETLNSWEDIAAFVTDPLLALELAHDLGLVNDPSGPLTI